MENNTKPKRKKAIASVLVALSVIAVVSILVYKNQEEVADLGQALVKKGKTAAKKGIKKSSFLKDQFSDLIDSLESKVRKAVA